MLAAVAIVLARSPADSRSMSTAVPVPVMSAADNPDSSRPTSSAAKPCAVTKTVALSADSTSAASRTGRRPSWSDTRPNATRPANTPTAYTAKMTVTVNDWKLNAFSYSG